jgi:hypothetical protein
MKYPDELMGELTSLMLETPRCRVSLDQRKLASADGISVVFTRLCPRLWLLRATSRRPAKDEG